MDGPPHVETVQDIATVGLGRLPDEARALYATLAGFRAIAVGRNGSGGQVWGYAMRSATAAQAANRALSECAARAGQTPATCVLAAVDGPASGVSGEVPAPRR